MADPRDLFELIGEAPRPGAVLVHALHGFMDAGQSGRIATDHMLSTLSAREVARFDTDELIDYRGRRPAMTFEADRYLDVVDHDIVVHAVRDDSGKEFLVLTGPEPDFRWERFVTAVGLLMHDLGATRAVGIHGIPWGTPHTRPLGLSAHASDRSLIAGRPRWFTETVMVPGNIAALLELRLPDVGIEAVGFSVHVPHYLASGEFTPGAVALIDAIAQLGDLSLALPDLRSQADESLREIDRLVAENPETNQAIRGMESAYDAAVEGKSLPGPQTVTPSIPDDELPDGDALAAEFEQFLKDGDGTK